ncbi:DUF3592 domain-containing protein [Fulvivirga ligni]|uniref:DUF3592 domain-containing protein n=1 Tax=Fulvivirga ligni TaxID=2904246 RepID=UPI001F166D6A|nr:DUF3592 domain-containing protein [Fulvivirga ligni]UII22195.1 hypothetical protein LVD16_02980 [Fulvivirga ligni]
MRVTPDEKAHVRTLLVQGKKIEAIKFLRNNYNLSLRDAKEMADLIDEDIREDEYTYKRKKGAKKVISLAHGCLSVFFGIMGAGLLAVAIYIFMGQLSVIQEGEKVTGVVVSDPNQPVIEYTLNGQQHTHVSNISSEPPNYVIGEEVELFVSPSGEVVINTFSERYLFICIIGFFALMLMAVGYGVYRSFKKKIVN